ncbi:NPCBM/NEW2 domain-containing protein [Streptomyces sp. NPDC029554]|uniref:NPCBM/NEW2 domain-containing protein n=1 Tax=Streptomyces sp. NPDC029554 TaxID=3155126 RepID=UPI0033E20BFF
MSTATPISVLGRVHPTATGVASLSMIRCYLGDWCTRLTTTVGIDDAVRNVGPEGGTAAFQVLGDGKVLFDSGSSTATDPARPTSI